MLQGHAVAAAAVECTAAVAAVGWTPGATAAGCTAAVRGLGLTAAANIAAVVQHPAEIVVDANTAVAHDLAPPAAAHTAVAELVLDPAWSAAVCTAAAAAAVGLGRAG